MKNFKIKYYHICLYATLFVLHLIILNKGAKLISEREDNIETATVVVTNETISLSSDAIDLRNIEEGIVYNPLFNVEKREVEVPVNKKYHGQKTYEYYTAITNKKSRQYQLQEDAETDENGFRTLNGRYLVAIGTYFEAEVGTYFDLELENGTKIHCIVGDIKADCDTDDMNVFSKSGCCSEFIVAKSFPTITNCSGDVSKVMTNWDSKVVTMKIYEYNYFEKE